MLLKDCISQINLNLRLSTADAVSVKLRLLTSLLTIKMQFISWVLKATQSRTLKIFQRALWNMSAARRLTAYSPLFSQRWSMCLSFPKRNGLFLRLMNIRMLPVRQRVSPLPCSF